MKLVCTKENLKKGLSAVTRVVPTTNPLQVLNNILVKTDQGRIKLSSTNLEVGVNTWIGGKIEEEGALTVPAKLINEYINNLPTEKVTITTRDNDLNLESENYLGNIKGLSSEDFPLIPQVAEESFVKIEGGVLRQAFTETIWAASAAETQPEISGIYLSFEGDKLVVAATDRYRLAEHIIKLSEALAANKEVIVPARTIMELTKMLTTSSSMVEVYFSESQVLFKFDQTELISRLIDGSYPDYRQIIPKDFNTQALFDREELIHALRITALFAPDSNNIQLEVGAKSTITVAASSVSAGENITKVPAKISGSDNRAVFNYRYLLDCLNNLSEEKVMLKLINDSSPAQLVPEGRSNYLYIVMPIKL